MIVLVGLMIVGVISLTWFTIRETYEFFCHYTNTNTDYMLSAVALLWIVTAMSWVAISIVIIDVATRYLSQ